MDKENVRYIRLSQSCLYVGLLLCAVLRPHGLTINQGISYYGVFWQTIVPYGFGLFGAAYFCMRSAMRVNRPDLVIVKYSLLAVSLLIVGIVLTPDTLNRYITDTHEAIGSVLFIIQLLLSGWLIVRLRYNSWCILLSLLELSGGIMSFIYLEAHNGYLFEAQVFFQICFGILMIYSLPRLVSKDL